MIDPGIREAVRVAMMMRKLRFDYLPGCVEAVETMVAREKPHWHSQETLCAAISAEIQRHEIPKQETTT